MKRRSSDGARGPNALPRRPGPGIGAPAGQEAPREALGGLPAWLEKIKVKTLLLSVFIFYVSVPFILFLFPSLLQKFVYLNFLNYPLWVDFSKPEVFLNHTTNFYLTSEPGITLGIWHTLPGSRQNEAEGKDGVWFQEALADENPVLIYLHGNGGTRAVSYRVAFTKVMSGGGFHVLAVDYRGYADSTGHPSEDGFTRDLLFLYDWVKARSGNSTLLFWGHSLGTGIATNTAKKLKEKGIVVDAIVLEAPFTSIRDAAAHIYLTKIYRRFPGFEFLVLDNLARAGMHFSSDKNVKVLSSPLLILHSEEDFVIPVYLGKTLFEIAHNATTKKEHVRFLSFPASLGLGHEHICTHPDIVSIVKNFLSSVK